MKYDETDIARRYDSARRLPEATLRLWLDAIAREAPPGEVRTILDVGCGTGRFCTGLAEKFHAQVIGVDPSDKMLAEARRNISHPNVRISKGDAAGLPVSDGSACLVYLSMVYHHISNLSDAAREFRRVLRARGFLCIRNSTLDLLEETPYLNHFPSAMEFNRKRAPSQRDVIDTMGANGFSLLRHEVLELEFAHSWREYCDKVGQRALSDLAAIADADFEAGIKQMREVAARGAESGPVTELVDLFVFQKTAEPAHAAS